MKIDRSCATCEFCFSNPNGNGFICAGANYGEPINEHIESQKCWSISLNYWLDLIDKLSPEQRHIFQSPYPSLQKKEFRRVGVKTEFEYLMYCIENQE